VRRGRERRFVEGTEKGGPAFGDPLEMVNTKKRRRLRRAAAAWRARRPELDGLHVGFDVVAVREGRLQRLPDAS
jgi:Holliday junction resolvase-like predicted endonuclease